MSGIRFGYTPPETIEQFRQIVRTALEREGELSPALRQRLEQTARELGILRVDMERVLQEVMALPSVQAAMTRHLYEEGSFSTGYVIAEPCIGVKCAACTEVCPVDCIHPLPYEESFEAVQQLYIDPDTCIDCGYCEPECPVEAIFPADDLPDRWRSFAKKNADWYRLSAKDFQAKWGSPGRW